MTLVRLRLYCVLLGCFWIASFALAERFYYLGSLGESAIQMDLTIEGATAIGSFYYDAVGLPSDIAGEVDEAGQVRLGAYTSADTTLGRTLTGTFVGSLSTGLTDYGTTFSGTWTNPEGGSYPFTLTKVAEYASITAAQNRLRVTARYPFVFGPLAKVSFDLQNDLLTSLFDFLREGQDHALADDIFNGWWLERSQTVYYASADLISIGETLHVYTGGAHPNTGLMGYTFGAIDGEVRALRLADFFLEEADYLAILSPFVLEGLREQGAQWVVDGAVDGLGKDDLSTFTLSPVGLTFGFEPYAMGPYAQGSFRVTVPFEVLHPVIDPAGPLARFVRNPL